ncbi:thioredoxin family protein [Mycobacterium kansasii]|uniref:Thioredoxin family protein n=1 Tax=Mycobacterium kansasii TaxID=1768 RepID=A0A1V3XFR0_MYCKA|nr:thioredoxin family protein [Mycobacterium kansasii]
MRPCRSFAPTFQASSEKHPDVVYAKVNTEEEQELAAAAQIRSIPTLMAFKKANCCSTSPGPCPRRPWKTWYSSSRPMKSPRPSIIRRR